MSYALKPIAFSDIAEWQTDDILAAYETFRMPQLAGITRPHDNISQEIVTELEKLRQICCDINPKHAAEARDFFEKYFTPYRADNIASSSRNGMVTGYFEPVVKASRVRTKNFSRALNGLPSNHYRIDPDADDYPDDLPKGLNAARNIDGKWEAYPKRGEIHELSDDGNTDWLSPIAYLDPVDVYFIHIQGSATLEFDDGEVLRVAYAGRNGHGYTSIGKEVIKRGYLTKDNTTYETLVAWLKDNPDLRDDVLHVNDAYIFFAPSDYQNATTGPVAAAGVPLTELRSLAIDRRFHPYHLPIWVDTHIPPIISGEEDQKFSQLMIAQDTGAAIKGVERGDIFFGRGTAKGIRAGNTQHRADFTLLVPNSVDMSKLKYEDM